MHALFGKTLPELTELMAGLGQKPYRARQVFEALYKQRVGLVEDVTTLSQELRDRLTSEGFAIGLPEIAQTAKSVDGTERYLMRMADGETVETVWMPDGDGGERGDGSEAAEEESAEVVVAEEAVDGGYWSRRGNGRDRSNFGTLAEQGFRRATICISSQVGCAVNCQFCLTAKLGIKRNLTAGEIAGQVAAVLNRHRIQIGKDRINLVFMGMGEPFLNYEQFMQSVRVLVEGIGIPESRMTVSTSGILPGIEAFAKETMRPKLALSLNASNDVVRERIMPITRKWNIAALLEAVQKIPLRTREWVTFEYVLLGEVNDQPEHAREVLELLDGIRAKVNLIVWNPGPGIDYHQPKPADVAVFQKMLIEGGIATYIRRPRGRDIYAACGQLKRTVAEEKPQLVGISAAS
ncbi:23S rRNA (adenine(2503)-C(2))-methyltransferase RlmN [Granulicella mallensis]|uniref:Probable dual-specificity RNA methyltransferase RlmN n=1 Tax=Granulicella mallensis (strain ATCC BAA-1857 / DSM 23137 / MP5ACTX8) TaxID=682795 RepID=G8NQD5_GRAMM|nr:23S rRNA (adenine(2503)-C(2))-methyltransferase RlmN [Granulicella mallensis]AEU36084.1 radical SAM enzyme, Cfr family [Granulicella mallensis MP5ACTX8]